MEFLIHVIIGVAIAEIIIRYVDWSTNRACAEDNKKIEEFNQIVEDLKESLDMDKFYEDFEKLYYPKGYFEM